MPTIIALDISLTMQKNLPNRNDTYLQLAIKGISHLLDYLAQYKLEHVLFLTYAANVDLKVDFTRDYDQIRSALKKLDSVEKLNPLNMLKGVALSMTSVWGTQSHCQVVAFTDCGTGFGSSSLRTFLTTFAQKESDPEMAWVEALRSVKLNFVCIGGQGDYYFTKGLQVYQQMVEKCKLNGEFFATTTAVGGDASSSGDDSKPSTSSAAAATGTAAHHKSELNRTAMLEIVDRLIESNYKMFDATLKCGDYFRLECPIIIWPNPRPTEDTGRMISKKLEVCGYLALSEIGSPSSLSRHLVMPRKNGTGHAQANSQNIEFEKLETDIKEFYRENANDDTEATASKSSSNSVADAEKENVCVLLHGALKAESMAALVLVDDNWYGFIYADSKKKAHLMLNILPPGSNSIPWLGDLQLLGFAEDLMPGETASFPVKSEKRSYSQSCVVWIRHASLQADVQKVLRHAKKMPDKTQHFYKELNRLRRAALSIGFVELLEAMAASFEKESATTANPECSLQLTHAAIELRKPVNRDIKVSITPAVKFPNAEQAV